MNGLIHLLSIIRHGILLTMVVLSGIEMFFFYRLSTFIGCVVTLLSILVFNKYILQYDVVTKHPISFVALLPLYCFMILPLPITLIEGHGIDYGMIIPQITFPLQFLFFIIAIVCFTLSCHRKKGLFSPIIAKMGFFSIPSIKQLWLLGFIGIIMRFLIYNIGTAAGTLAKFDSLMYAPICILFGPLLGRRNCTKNERMSVWLYIVLVSVIMISTNSRNMALSFVGTWVLIYIIYFVHGHTGKKVIFKKKFIIYIIIFFGVLGPLNDLAVSMVIVRSERTHISMTELFYRTLDTFNDKEMLYKYQVAIQSDNNEVGEFNDVWKEYYVSNPFLARLCNYRVADATLYHALHVGIPNKALYDEFITRLKITFPSPIVTFLFGRIDKDKHLFSPMDYLYFLSTKEFKPSFIVGGDVGLGLGTFGTAFWIIMFIVYYFIFNLFDSLFYVNNGKMIFSFMALIWLYTHVLGAFRVGSGLWGHITDLLWGFPLTILIYALLYKIVQKIFP